MVKRNIIMSDMKINIVKCNSGKQFDESILSELGIQYLWHYTSSDSFIKIIKSKQLRYTDCLFLNDIEEFKYIFQVLNEYIAQNRKHADFVKSLTDVMDEDNYDFVPCNVAAHNGYKFMEGRYYILSGSSNSDSLPLWTYYSKSGKYDGYSIKIDVAKVFRNFKLYGQGTIYAGKVEYALQNQLDIIEECIDLIICNNYKKRKQLDKNILSPDEIVDRIHELEDELKYEAFDFLNTCRLFFKNSKFAFESEIRIAVLVGLEEINGNKCDADFTSVNGIIKPSIGLCLEPEFPIVGLNFGPMIDEDLAKAGVNRLFNDLSISTIKDFPINKSRIKIRY